jgi:hypothetical protein
VSGADELTWQDIINVQCRKNGSQTFESVGSTSQPRLSELGCAYDAAEKWIKANGFWRQNAAECRAVKVPVEDEP